MQMAAFLFKGYSSGSRFLLHPAVLMIAKTAVFAMNAYLLMF